MEIRNITNAASSGNLQTIRSIFENSSHPKTEINSLVNGIFNGATPLIVACRNGHLSIVEYLVEKCGADIEQVGSVQFDGELIDGAPALWCASAAGHLPIVKYLVKAGAQVNKTTYTNSTPLRAACFDGHFEIVKFLLESNADIEMANRHGHTCLMISCYKGHINIVQLLLDKHVDVNRKSLKGNTALHDCAESGYLDIMKLLFKYNAKMEKDAYGITPLLAASVTGNTKIVEYLIARTECSREDRVEALELLGCTYVDKKRDLLGAAKFWKMALTERYRNVQDILHKPRPLKLPVPAYNNATEIESQLDLENIVSDPDEMRMQSLLIRERILGPTHPDTSYYIRYRGAVYADSGDFVWCLSLWKYALEMQQKFLEPLSLLTQSSFLSFAELFSFMTTETSADRHTKVKSPLAVLDDLIFVLNCGIDEIERGMKHLNMTESHYKLERDTNSFSRYLVIVLHLVSLTCKRFKSVEDKERRLSFLKAVFRLVKLKCRNENNLTLLHLACNKETSVIGRYPVCNFPDSSVIKILIEVGADCSDRDKFGNTPLHLASRSDSRDVIKLLLKCGAHLCTTNYKSQTASDMLSDVHMFNIVPILNYTNLQCLAAKAIISNKIPYKGEVPLRLEKFLELH